MDDAHQRLGKCTQPNAHPLSWTTVKLFLAFTQNFLHNAPVSFDVVRKARMIADDMLDRADAKRLRIEIVAMPHSIKVCADEDAVHHIIVDCRKSLFQCGEILTQSLFLFASQHDNINACLREVFGVIFLFLCGELTPYPLTLVK